MSPGPTKPSQSRAGEIWGGFASMLVALPASIAFGVAVYGSLGPEFVTVGALAGIVGALAIGLVAPTFGGTPRLISAPCAPAAAVMAALALELVHRNPNGVLTPPAQVVALLGLVALMAGGLQILYSVLGGGRLIKYIPYPVVAGYLSGVAVLIFLSQIPKFLGLPKEMSVWQGLLTPDAWQWPGLVVGACTMAGMILTPKLTRKVPATIAGLAAGVGAYFLLGLFLPGLLQLENNRLVIGSLNTGATGSVFASFGRHWHALGDLRLDLLQSLFMPALTLSVLLSIDTLKTCVVVDALTRSRHNSNRELLGQGLANMASSLLGGMPGAGTMGATLININSGGRTRLSGILEGAFVLAVLLAFSRHLGWVPIAALAGILMVVAFRMIDRDMLHLLRQKSTILDFGVIATVVLVAVTVNLIAAAVAGLALAMLLFIREQMHGAVIRRKAGGHQMSSKKNRLPAEKRVLLEKGAQTTVCELQGSLFFGTTDRLYSELEPDLKRARYVILDLRRVQSVDFTAAHLLEQIGTQLDERGACLLFSNLPSSLPTGQDIEAYFHQVGLVKPARHIRVFPTLDEALEWTEDQILEDAKLRHESQARPLALGEIELLREFAEDHTLPALQSCVECRSYQAGDTVFASGAESDELVLVRRGSVRILLPLENGGHVVLAVVGRGNFFGEVAFLDCGRRTADAVAETDTEVFVLSRRRFNELAREQAVVGVKIFARLARALALRLRQTDAELRALRDS